MSRFGTRRGIASPATDGTMVMESVSPGPCALHVPLSWSEPCDGRAVRVEPDMIWVELDCGRRVPENGARVVIEGPWAVRLMGIVASSEARQVCVTVSRAVERDRRAAQRTLGGIDLRYAVARNPEQADAWLERGDAPGLTWHLPDPFMSFSATGLRFEHAAVAGEGDLLLLELSVPRRSERWRATGRVVRVTDIPPAEQAPYVEGEPAPTHRVAVCFEGLPAAARETLTERGLEILRAIRR